jgi:demethylmenaquinone methyltransferase/2-methoxy-6-polyprenyl-1,4-benzoquinol methylase
VTSDVLRDQIAYYRMMARTGQFDRAYARTGRYDRGGAVAAAWADEVQAVRVQLHRFDPRGDVLELACGSGMWTAELARGAATSITAVDAAPEMLELNRRRVGDRRVRYVQADLFSWHPGRRYDCVVFGLWLSHVPPELFEAFWRRLGEWLVPGGRVFFVDSLYDPDRTATDERLGAPGDAYLTRRLDTGEEYRIVKVFYDPPRLADRLRALGWRIHTEVTGRFFFVGHATCAGDGADARAPRERR